MIFLWVDFGDLWKSVVKNFVLNNWLNFEKSILCFFLNYYCYVLFEDVCYGSGGKDFLNGMMLVVLNLIFWLGRLFWWFCNIFCLMMLILRVFFLFLRMKFVRISVNLLMFVVYLDRVLLLNGIWVFLFWFVLFFLLMVIFCL